MNCHIIKEKKTGQEYLIPGCWSVINNWHVEGMTDKQIIKEYCNCYRSIPKNEKYETKTRDEVFALISELKDRVKKYEDGIEKIKEEIGILESEVFMLNVEIIK